ncbi:MAG: tRNA (adenosine(37)-N6)-threonylcarbamoyltransferase complex ATPase subunit type 1 TsaE [Patescibacteria group bacterium]
MKSDSRHVEIKIGQKSKKFLVHEVADWEVVAKYLVKLIKPGSVIALSGPLGAGKTTLTQFIARELGVKKNAISPTFALMRIYHVARSSKLVARKISDEMRDAVKRSCEIRRVVHVDAYRIESERDAMVLDLYEELLEPGTLMIIEWPENIKKIVSRLKPIKVAIKY